MLTREIIEPKNEKLNVSRNHKLPHSPGVRAGDFLFLSGMVSTDPNTGEMRQGTLTEEATWILENMKHLLESNGSSLENVVKTSVVVYDMLELPNVNKVFAKFFPNNPPARTVCGARLSFGLKVEIEAIAVLNK
jgi:reactive intermediate/imine deaminase